VVGVARGSDCKRISWIATSSSENTLAAVEEGVGRGLIRGAVSCVDKVMRTPLRFKGDDFGVSSGSLDLVDGGTKSGRIYY